MRPFESYTKSHSDRTAVSERHTLIQLSCPARPLMYYDICLKLKKSLLPSRKPEVITEAMVHCK